MTKPPVVINPPIIIAAPTQRCGTTLIQRALNSTKQAIVYGENFHLVENIPEIVANIETNLDVKVERTTSSREQLILGRYDQDLSALYPDYGAYAALIKAKFFDLLNFYAAESVRHGFARWGVKNQITNLNGFLSLVRLVPNLTCVIVYRDIGEVIRSHKARFPRTLSTLNDYRAYGARWARNYRVLRSFRGPGCLHIEHRDLVQSPDFFIDRLEKICGISGIDRAVFTRKINVSPIIDTLTLDEAESGYRPPADLSVEEYEAVMSTAGETALHYGYSVQLERIRSVASSAVALSSAANS
jgi:hypothetical protein